MSVGRQGPGPAPQPPVEPLPTASPARTRAAVRALVRPRRGLAVAAVLALGAAAAVSLLTAPLLGAVIDAVTVRDRPWQPLVTALAVVAPVQGLLVVLGGILVTRLAEAVLADLRESYVERALGLSLDRIERAGDGDLTARVADDVTIVGEAARTAVPEFARSIMLIALTGVGLAALDARFLLAALLAVPIQVGTAVWYVRRSTPLYREQRLITGELQDQLLDAVGGARTVLAYQLEPAQLGAVAERSRRRVATVLRVVGLHTRFFGRLNAAEYVGLSAVLVAGFVMVRSGTVTVGVASAAALYFISLFAPVNQALFVLDTVQSATASLARLVGVVDLPRATGDPAGPAPADGTVRTTGLTHAYRPGHEVLSDVDLEIPDGTRVALVGASGAGKTTLAGLMAGVHGPTGGEVLIGGAPLDPERAGRRPVVLVTQEVHVFAGTVADDLRLADPDADDARLRAALDRVGALEWVEALPDGTATVVGGGARRLTPVQAQQLALARLVLAAPLVAVLDEATAEAGSAGAATLERAALAAVDGRTAVLVAHRLSQAASADLVLVMHDGRIVEQGHHDDLVRAGGRYGAMWAAWSGQRDRSDALET